MPAKKHAFGFFGTVAYWGQGWVRSAAQVRAKQNTLLCVFSGELTTSRL